MTEEREHKLESFDDLVEMYEKHRQKVNRPSYIRRQEESFRKYQDKLLDRLFKDTYSWNAWRKRRKKDRSNNPKVRGLDQVDLSGLDLSNTNLDNIDLTAANLTDTNFRKSNLRNANFTYAHLENTNFTDADISKSKVWGIQSKDVILNRTIQNDLCISYTLYSAMELQPDIPFEYRTEVDDFETAEFFNKMCVLHELKSTPSFKKNEENKNVNSVPQVLLLGRFSSHKPILEELHKLLKTPTEFPQLYWSTIFDYPPLPSRDLTEEIYYLAYQSRFIIADLSDPMRAPWEVNTIANNFPSIPILPIFQGSGNSYSDEHIVGQIDHALGFSSVVRPFMYTDIDDLRKCFFGKILLPAELKFEKFQAEKYDKQQIRY